MAHSSPYSFTNHATDGGWTVMLNGAVIGRVVPRHRLASRQFSKSSMVTRHVDLWAPTPEGAGLMPEQEREIRRHITRDKTRRNNAADHLVQAYQQAGVPLPTGDERRKTA